jgi:aminoglycoside phosphotransferase (APT) family kinase protein
VPAGIDFGSLAPYLRVSGLSDARSLDATLIGGGRSNLTYLLCADDTEWVLRRPPLGHTLATAHDVSREYRVMAALSGTDVPVPGMVHLCSDPGVIGAPFFLMERIQGTVLHALADVRRLSAEERTDLFVQLISVLAALHNLDPNSVGLAGFGRPEGFMQRQVRRWTTQLGSTMQPSRDMTSLAEQLATSVPIEVTVSVVHGDYRLDNCLALDARITAVLDWEMSTLGDPLSDLGMFSIYHDGLADLPNPVVQSPGRISGAPSLDDLLEIYAKQTGIAIHDFGWYQAFAWFKLAVILAGVDQRASRGQAAGQEFEGVRELIDPCVERGLAAIGEIA